MEILMANNPELGNSNTLDLHGLYIKEALDILKQVMYEKKQGKFFSSSFPRSLSLLSPRFNLPRAYVWQIQKDNPFRDYRLWQAFGERTPVAAECYQLPQYQQDYVRRSLFASAFDTRFSSKIDWVSRYQEPHAGLFRINLI